MTMTLDDLRAAANNPYPDDAATALPQTTITLPDSFDFGSDSAARDSLPEILVCEFCGLQLEYSGRGKKPKYCADHKTAASRGETPTHGTRVPRTRTWSGGADVERNLIAGLDFILLPSLALDVDAPLRKDAVALDKYGPRIIHELVVLAATDTRLRAILIRLSAPGKYGALLGATFALVLSVANNHLNLPLFLQGAISNLTEPNGGES